MSRICDANKEISDEDSKINLRPQKLNDYIGQEVLKRNLKVYIKAALKRNEVLDHILFYGPPGLGKTTLANIIANEMNTHIKIVNGPSIEKTGDLAAILSTIEPGDILFIDEIHRLPRVVEEVLYSAMEDYVLSIVVAHEVNSTAINLDLPPFTLIGATTRMGDLSSPLRTRFGIVEKISFYTTDELCEIVKRTASVFDMNISDSAVLEIAKRCRGTPRIANRIFKRVRDFAFFEGKKSIDIDDTLIALNALRIDDIGLDDVDLNYLITLFNRFNCGPVGLQTLANSIGEEANNLEDVCEPFLQQIGFIDRTIRGRKMSEKGIEHLKKYHMDLIN